MTGLQNKRNAAIGLYGRALISAAQYTTGIELHIKHLRKPSSPIKNIVDNIDNDSYILDSRGKTHFNKTNRNAPNGKVVTTTVQHPSPGNWNDLITETENVFSAGAAGGKIFATYMIDAINQVYQYSIDGDRESQIELPGLGPASGFAGRKQDSLLYYTFTSYVYPTTIFEYHLNSF